MAAAGVNGLSGMRVLIVGASSGIGRAIAAALVEAGAKVVVAARRQDRLDALCDELCGGATPVVCDVRAPADCERVVEETVAILGGLDALVYATGLALLSGVADADAERWRAVFETNVVGPSLITRAAISHLEASEGRAVYLSSIAADDRPPRRGLGLYITSKAALNRLIDVWQEEHRGVCFTRVSVGDTGSTEMAVDWDRGEGQRYVGDWIAKGFLFGRSMEPASVARHIVDVLASDERLEVTRILPRYPVEG